ncbi:NifU family protein [Streptomyces sp. ICN988]|uniref:NifU family protein n=1 Tax=Streptomyces sp. ICN988 TaxID=2983765 RepID=UPI0021E488A7|nr:NifU family protein [Streptomyces sp. ICN988]MCV2457796.1 NifU family protein [Streptomyces sp. ICN988]
MAEPAGTPPRLGDDGVAARIAHIDELLEKVETAPGPTARAAVDAVRALTEVYGEALARVLDHADHADPALAGQLAEDELLGHLLVLHDIHPEPPERRAARAVERLRPAVQERGGDVELVDVDERTARIRLDTPGCGSGCGSASTEVEDAVREAVLAAAPELTAVEPVPVTGTGTFVPLDTLTRRPAQPQGVS